MLKIDYINYHIEQRELLTISNLSLDKNGLYAVVGLNGSGKSLFCRAISRQLDNANIKIFYDNMDISKLSQQDYAKTISYLDINRVESSFFNVEQTILSGYYSYTNHFENIDERLRIKMLNLLVKFDLPESILKQSFASVSMGERGRVLLIRNLLIDSPVLVLDEVLANLDLKHEISALAYLKEIASTKIIILVSHNLSLLSSYANYLIALKTGKLYKYGDFITNFNTDFLSDCFGIKARLEPKKIGLGYHLEF